MATVRVWKRSLLLFALCAMVGGSFVAGQLLLPRRQVTESVEGDGKRAMVTPTCRIEILPAVERIRRMNAPVNINPIVAPYPLGITPPHRVPFELAENPVLLSEHYATVRFENTTGRPLILYVVRWCDGIGCDPLIQNTAIVAADVRDSGDGVIKEPPPRWRSVTDPEVPSAKLLRANNHPLFILPDGGHIDLPIPILGRLDTPRTKPGTYKVRAIVSYAEAPDGETMQITSEPVNVTVTEEHIKAAEAYWATLKN